MNGVKKATGTKYEMAGSAGSATVRRPVVVTRGATSEPTLFSFVSGATTVAIAGSYVWNGAVNGDTASARNASAQRFLSILTFIIVAGNEPEMIKMML
jgi:hypothetical protein